LILLVQNGAIRARNVLPVEPGDESRWSGGLGEAMKHDLHNKHRVIFVASTFSQLPWYADHPTNREVRQERCFTERKISHEYRDGPQRIHDWHSGWLAEAVELAGRSGQGSSKTAVNERHGQQKFAQPRLRL